MGGLGVSVRATLGARVAVSLRVNMGGEGVKECVGYGGDISVRLDNRPVDLTIRQVESVQSRGDGSVRVTRVRDEGVCVLADFFEGKMIFEFGPAFRESTRAIVVGRVRGCIFVFVIDKIEVPSHDEVGGGGYARLEGNKLGSSGSGAVRVQIEIKGNEAMRVVLGGENQANGMTIEAFGEGDDSICVKGVDVWGNDNRHSGGGFGEAAVPDSKVRR